jgi:CHAT domain
MSASEGIDPDLLRQALDVVKAGAAGGAGTEPAVAASFTLNRAIRLLRDGRVSEATPILAALAGQDASILPYVPPSVGLEAAVRLAEAAFGSERWDLVIAAEQLATPHLNVLASRTQDLFSRDAISAKRGGLATLAAYAAARTGALDDALRILEHGRTTMLAERFQAPIATPSGAVADAKPVIQLVATHLGGLALICADGLAARAIWLDQLGGADFSQRLISYLAALDGMRRNSALGLRAWMREVAGLVRSLRAALEPLLAAFPREPLTIVPVGVLSLLPVTAALLADDDADRAVSLLPSLGAGPVRSPDLATDSALIVTEPELPAARWETAGVHGFFSESNGPPRELSAMSVLAALPPGGVAHFGCHAEADPGAPLRSALILPGNIRLTVQDVLASRPGSVQGTVVVLSACESGLAGPSLLDEAIGLPIAFLAAGCGAVVSTLWLVEDLSTALVMLRFYWHWRHENLELPLALARAMLWLRSTSDQAKCQFAEVELVAAGALSAVDGSELADSIRDRSDWPDENSFSEPFFWAGFYITSR